MRIGVQIASALLFASYLQMALGQTGLRTDRIPAGRAPAGVDVTRDGTGADRHIYIAVANSGANSVSIFELVARSLVLKGSVSVPAPSAVTACGSSGGPRGTDISGSGDRFIVVSPSENAVHVIRAPDAAIVATLAVGPQPGAVDCTWLTGRKAIVSNTADDSVTVIDVEAGSVTSRISGVPASRNPRGIAFVPTAGNIVAWVAGASVVTLVDISASRVLAQIPVAAPTAVRCCAVVASAAENRLLFFNPSTLQVVSRSPLVTNPQAFTNSGIGYVVVQGGTDSVAVIDPANTAVSTIAGIPGPLGTAAYSFSDRNMDPQTALVLITSSTGDSVFVLPQQTVSIPSVFPVRNAASFTGSGAAPGGLATAFAPTGVLQSSAATSLPLPTNISGLTLRVGGRLELFNGQWSYSPEGSILAPLLFVSPTQINFQVPPRAPRGYPIPAELQKPDGTKLLTTLGVPATTPGIFTVLGTGQGQAAALNQDNSLNGNPGSLVGARPATRGSVIQIFATGAGATVPELGAGEPAPSSGFPLVYTVAQPVVSIGGRTARVFFSGLAPGFVGLWQVNAEIPSDVTPGSAVPVTITAGGITSNTATIAVQ